MKPEQINLVLEYLKNRKENNDFAKMLLQKLKNCKSDGEKIHYIQKCINPNVLRKIITGELI